MKYKEFFRPSKWKIITTGILLIIAFNFLIIGIFGCVFSWDGRCSWQSFPKIIGIPFLILSFPAIIIEPLIWSSEIIPNLVKYLLIIMVIIPYHYLISCMIIKSLRK